MINLIPPHYSQAMRTGRANAKLVRWLFASMIATGGLLLIVMVGWFYLNHVNTSLNKSIEATKQQLVSQHLSDVQNQAAEINGNVKIINQVLGREIRFSDLIQSIGAVLPNGTVLNSLTLGKVDGGLDLSAGAKDYTSAAQIAVNLSDSKNKIFDKVDIVNIHCAANSDTAYACSGTYKALFNTTAKKRFLNAATGDNK